MMLLAYVFKHVRECVSCLPCEGPALFACSFPQRLVEVANKNHCLVSWQGSNFEPKEYTWRLFKRVVCSVLFIRMAKFFNGISIYYSTFLHQKTGWDLLTTRSTMGSTFNECSVVVLPILARRHQKTNLCYLRLRLRLMHKREKSSSS